MTRTMDYSPIFSTDGFDKRFLDKRLSNLVPHQPFRDGHLSSVTEHYDTN